MARNTSKETTNAPRSANLGTAERHEFSSQYKALTRCWNIKLRRSANLYQCFCEKTGLIKGRICAIPPGTDFGKNKMDSKKRKAKSSVESKYKKKSMAKEMEEDDFVKICEWTHGTKSKISFESKNRKRNSAKEMENYSSDGDRPKERMEILEDKALNEKENHEGKNTRPKRATKTTFQYNTYDYSIGLRMPCEKKNGSKPEVKTVMYSDSESDMEEFRPPPEDLVFDDFYPATRNLDNTDKDKLVNMNRLRQIVWTCPKRNYDVEPLHCLKLVSNDDTIDFVVGSWMSILEDKFKKKSNVPTCYLGYIYFSAMLRSKSAKALKKELDKMKGKRLLCFPVCTPVSANPSLSPNHWTLIVLDVKDRKWTHFNTMRIGTNWNYHHNQGLMDWVDENLGEEYVETERENYEDTPQQPNGSNDCGICLLMILEQLMLGKTKEQIKDLFEFNKEEIEKYRTLMVQTFLRLGEIQKEQKM